MGRVQVLLDAILYRKSRKTSKLKTLLGMTVARLAVLRNQRDVRCAHARGDVAQLLRLEGQQDRALLRGEQVIKEQNMLDAFVLIEGYCHLLSERAVLLERIKECPEDLKEAISSLTFAASRCGELPELQEVRYIFASKFGKGFTVAAVELRNSCGVNPKLIQKLSSRQPSLESRVKIVEEIAAANGIGLDLEEPISESAAQVVQNLSQTKQPISNLGELDDARTKYKDVVSAAEAAFESAAYAAAAARVAVELSKSESRGWHQSSPVRNYSSKSESESESELESEPEPEPESDDGLPEIMQPNTHLLYEPKHEQVTELEKSSSHSSSTSSEIIEEENKDDNFDGVSTIEGVPIKRGVSYLHPPYQKGNPVNYKTGLRSSNDAVRSRDERIVSQRPVSMRTRRGF